MGLKLILGSIVLLGLGACKSIKLAENQQYQLTQFSCQKHQTPHGECSLFVSPPEALRGYDGIKMNYSTQPYEVKAFVHHAWLGSPAQMIHPLLTQSLQCSNYFKAVSSGIYSDRTDYRLDSQLLMLQQNFTSSPSQVELVMKLVLNDVKNNSVITSKIFHYQQNCPTDTPYGGVLAANAVVKQFTSDAVNFVGKNIH